MVKRLTFEEKVQEAMSNVGRMVKLKKERPSKSLIRGRIESVEVVKGKKGNVEKIIMYLIMWDGQSRNIHTDISGVEVLSEYPSYYDQNK